ncbi:hypothetical protein PVAND_006524 [Polypedilum vanderplanki]|uniref:Uncharacterized protein n=1 Tax=Polypedilum vanderplanki TaxID=319348 RepID=A0A9J6C3X2_POLVA|nr:hypothetical protein PVAND_006524 [Polypedilum vanderplanki]
MEFIYSFISEGMDKRPAYGFSQKLRAAVEKQYITPSPLDYQSETVTSRHQKGFTFGHRPRTNYVRDFDLPSPCEYFIGDLPSRPPNAPTFGVKPRSRRPISHSPGPKYYPQTQKCSLNKKPGSVFGTESRRSNFQPKDGPGPGEYNTNKSNFSRYNGRGFSFGMRFPTLIS